MKSSKLEFVLPIGLALLAVASLTVTLKGQFAGRDTRSRRERFTPAGTNQNEGPAGWFDRTGRRSLPNTNLTEAPTGFDNVSNGFDEQGPEFNTIDEDTVVPLRSFNDNRFIFEEVEGIADGLGPTYNAQSCRECHQNVVTGGSSQITEHRTGRLEMGAFFESLGGSLLLEANSVARIGRFGWKSQHASLESFSADAYLNEMGITTPLFPEENTSSGRFVGFGSGFDPLPEPEDDGVDVVAFANFMRATKAPSRGAITADVLAGERIFDQISCTVCHVAAIATVAPGTVVNGGVFPVPNALGNKVIRPFSDYLLHEIGTGDGIPVLPLPEFASTTASSRR